MTQMMIVRHGRITKPADGRRLWLVLGKDWAWFQPFSEQGASGTVQQCRKSWHNGERWMKKPVCVVKPRLCGERSSLVLATATCVPWTLWAFPFPCSTQTPSGSDREKRNTRTYNNDGPTSNASARFLSRRNVVSAVLCARTGL